MNRRSFLAASIAAALSPKALAFGDTALSEERLRRAITFLDAQDVPLQDRYFRTTVYHLEQLKHSLIASGDYCSDCEDVTPCEHCYG